MKLMGHLGEGISAYLDGELDSVERRQVEGHLPGCERCRQELEDLMIVRARLRSMPMLDIPNLPPGLRPHRDFDKQPRAIYRRPKFILGAAAAAVAVLVAFATITAPRDAVFTLSDDTFAASYRARASLDPSFTGRPMSPTVFVNEPTDNPGG